MEMLDALGELLKSHPYLISFLVLLVEEAGVPLPAPGDVLIVYAGAFNDELDIRWSRFLATAVLASVLGSNFLYFVGKRLGPKFLARHGQRFHVTEARLERARQWLTRYGVLAVYFGRLLPGLRVVTSLAAGTLGLAWVPFMIGTVLSAATWWGFWFFVGVYFGPVVLAYVSGLSAGTGLFMFLLAVVGSLVMWRLRRRGRRKS